MQIGRTEVEALVGDIHEQRDVDAIAIATNEDDSVQEGSAVIIPGWFGGPQWVIHAVEPVYSESEHDNCMTLLDMAYESIFAAAEAQEIKRLALVVMQSGKIAWEVTTRFLRVHPHPFELIRFVSPTRTAEFESLLSEMKGSATDEHR